VNQLFKFIVNRHQDILRYAMFILAALAITYLYPKTASFKYEFEKGKPWKYENLIAPFSFGVLKSDASINKEKQKILENFPPYYRKDTTVLGNQQKQFVKTFNQEYRSLKHDTTFKESLDSAMLVQKGLNALEEVYQKGILNIAKEHNDFAKDRQVTVVKGNVAQEKKIGQLYNLRSAYQALRKKLKKKDTLQALILLPLLQQSLNYNITYDNKTSQEVKERKLENVSIYRGMVQKGEMIIGKGSIVTDEKHQILQSFKREYQKRVLGSNKGYVLSIGYFILTGIVLALFVFFLQLFAESVFESNRKIAFILLMMFLLLLLVKNISSTDPNLLYAVPFCILPITLRPFFGNQVALQAHISLLLLSSFITPYGYEFIFLQFIAGMMAIYSNFRAQYWSDFFLACFYIWLTYIVGYFGISLLQEANLGNVDYQKFGWLTLNALLTLLAYPLIPIFERLFGFVSAITLLELSDINKPLLKELSLKAPGTFQHSLQVANLAEATASEVGADPLLTKVGALYHDVGKMENPAFFIENQNAERNPHDDLPFEVSAKVITDHVKNGVKIAKKHGLQDLIIDFIRTHHGTSRVEFFYQSYLKNYPDDEVDEALFSYPGPLPYSKETAVLMMADSVEAASRSLKKPTSTDIERLVERIINYKIEQNQFINSDITFRDIKVSKRILKKMLNSIYHVRVSYPQAETISDSE